LDSFSPVKTIHRDVRWRPSPSAARGELVRGMARVESDVTASGSADEHDIRLDEGHAFRSAAVEVLRSNDLAFPDGSRFTRASKRLYPHQWSWDSAFCALGWSCIDVARAAEELQTLCEAQWKNGKLPHIVYHPGVPQGQYFPDAERWAVAEVAKGAPKNRLTSGICQPPVHAFALRRVVERCDALDDDACKPVLETARKLFPKLVAWHRYLLTERDPERSGLVTVLHPWESGLDNSPRWDAVLRSVVPVADELPGYERADLKNVADPSERPTQEDYDRYLWLVELYKRARYNDKTVLSSRSNYPFRVKDVWMSALLVQANVSLLWLAQRLGVKGSVRAQLQRWVALGRKGIASRWDAKLHGAVDYDLVAGKPLRVKGLANFAPLVAGGLSKPRQRAQLALLDSSDFCGAKGLARKLPTSTSPNDPAFEPQRYWRGPQWPVMTWVVWHALVESGATTRAEQMRTSILDLLRRHGFAEYFQPMTDAPLGARDQSWTAAVALDWLDA
jgi:glucosylglycerate hydrolase